MTTTHLSGACARRRLIRMGLALVLPAVAAPRAGAQRTFRTLGDDVRHAVGDAFGVWASPLRANGRDWITAGAVVGAGAAISPYDDDVDRWFLAHPNSAIAKFGEPFTQDYDGYKWADLPTGKRILKINGILYATGFVFDQSGLRDAGMGCLVAQQSNGVVRQLMYASIKRDRPSERPTSTEGDQYEIGVPGGRWEQHSFFGGHVANAAACAGFLSERFKLGPVEPLLLGWVAAVTAGRTVDRAHWTSDNLIGGVFGYAVGRVVARRQLERKAARERADRGEAMAEPESRHEMIIGNDGTRSYVGWELRFR